VAAYQENEKWTVDLQVDREVIIVNYFIRIIHQNRASCYLSAALSLHTENTALQQILS